METDIGNPIEYDPSIDSLRGEKVDNNMIHDEERRTQGESYYYQPSPVMYQPPINQFEKQDIFSGIEKSTWIIAFAVFLLGFFMGKTMQPVILRYT